MIHYSYPRLDIHVSKGMNHLLKSPYCVHPKTGKVCVPFNPKTVDKFDPMTVPTIEDLIDEINAFDEKDKAQQADVDEANTKKIKDYKKTSLNKSLHVFLEFLSHLKVTNKKPEHTGTLKSECLVLKLLIISSTTILMNSNFLLCSQIFGLLILEAFLQYATEIYKNFMKGSTCHIYWILVRNQMASIDCKVSSLQGHIAQWKKQ